MAMSQSVVGRSAAVIGSLANARWSRCGHSFTRAWLFQLTDPYNRVWTSIAADLRRKRLPVALSLATLLIGAGLQRGLVLRR
jgi:hypothetical protein